MSGGIALVTPFTKSHRTAEETLALGYLAAVLRHAGHDVSVVDGWLEALTLEELVDRIGADGPPALVGMSCYQSNLHQAEQVVQALRARYGDIPVICGGYGPTFHAEFFLKAGFTVAVIGEGEHIIVRLAEALMNGTDLGSIPSIAFLKDGQMMETLRAEPIVDLDEIPFPSRDTVGHAITRRNFVHVCTSRGCEAHCSFCSIFAFAAGGSSKLRWRHRGITNIVDELEVLHREFGVSAFKIVDDSFIEPPRDEAWAEAFRDEILGRGLTIRFRTQVRADRLTPDIVRALSEAGWFSTAVGIENAAPTALRRMRKLASPEDNEVALQLLEAHGVYVQMGMILFDPDTTLDELEINLGFLRRNRWPFTKGIFTEMYAAEGTPFTGRLGRRGLLVTANAQNYSYEVQDPTVRRVYEMLKSWHRAHSTVYDWVIDSLTAPKVLPDVAFRGAHALCRQLQAMDLRFLETVLSRVSEAAIPSEDSEFVAEWIRTAESFYVGIEEAIARLYADIGLRYEAVPNPFLT